MNQKKCSVCHEEFGCGAGFEPGSCWCVSFPPIMPLEFDQDCRCPACLSKSIDSRIGELINKNGVDRMLTLAEPYRNQSELVKDVVLEWSTTSMFLASGITLSVVNAVATIARIVLTS